MATRSVRWAGWTLAAGLVVASGACAKYNNLKARKAFKDANANYVSQDYKKAAAEYEEAVAADPDMVVAYFYLANSYDNLYKPTKKGDPQNDSYLQKALQYYKVAAERETDPKQKKLSLQYLAALYGPDKLNDPNEAEPYVKQLIDTDPSDAGNYFGLAKMQEDTGRIDEAEQTYKRAQQADPKNPAVYLQMAAFYNRQGQFKETIDMLLERARLEPGNPEAYYTISTYYWDKVNKDFRLKDPEKKDYIDKGMEAVDKAIQLKPDYFEALTYKNLLLRLEANLEKDPKKQDALLKQADLLRDQAIKIRKEKAAGKVG